MCLSISSEIAGLINIHNFQVADSWVNVNTSILCPFTFTYRRDGLRCKSLLYITCIGALHVVAFKIFHFTGRCHSRLTLNAHMQLCSTGLCMVMHSLYAHFTIPAMELIVLYTIMVMYFPAVGKLDSSIKSVSKLSPPVSPLISAAH